MLAEDVYRKLLVVYPKDFREEYGPLMVQLFRDRMLYSGGGFRGVVVWMQMIMDLVRTAFVENIERTKRRMQMTLGWFLCVVFVPGLFLCWLTQVLGLPDPIPAITAVVGWTVAYVLLLCDSVRSAGGRI